MLFLSSVVSHTQVLIRCQQRREMVCSSRVMDIATTRFDDMACRKLEFGFGADGTVEDAVQLRPAATAAQCAVCHGGSGVFVPGVFQSTFDLCILCPGHAFGHQCSMAVAERFHHFIRRFLE